MLLKVASLSDLNDATVLVTSLTRGENAINFDGTLASGSDKGWAVAGVALPIVSGSAAKNFLKGVGNILGLEELLFGE